MGLFTSSQIADITRAAEKSREKIQPATSAVTRSVNSDIIMISKKVEEYFKDSPAELITSVDELERYVDNCIQYGYAAIDCETTGLDKINDHVVGFSLYTPGRNEVYIPCKHIVPVFETLYEGQLTYEECTHAIQRLVDGGVKLVFANAGFDIAMFYKDIKVDLIPAFYYDTLAAWRCIKENEKDNALKVLYAKYPCKGKVDPKKFSDFFPPQLFKYCDPKVAKLYGANDAVITYKLMLWQIKYITVGDPHCTKYHFEKIASLVWNVEFPMVCICALLHRRGFYIDKSVSPLIYDRYKMKLDQAQIDLADMVDQIIAKYDVINNRKRPFASGKEFNANSSKHVEYLMKNLLGLELKSYDKEALSSIKNPVGKQILTVRNGVKLLGTYIDKLPKITGPDGRLHGSFLSVGADTGRMASRDPNLQNIPSKAHDIRHMFRAAPATDTQVKLNNGSVSLGYVDEVELADGTWAEAKNIKSGQAVATAAGGVVVSEVNEENSGITLVFQMDGLHDDVSIHVKTPHFVVMSSDYSQQEPKLSALVSGDHKMIDTFSTGKDIYATLASIGLGVPYEECLEFNPITGENQPEGKARRGVGKVLVLGRPRG